MRWLLSMTACTPQNEAPQQTRADTPPDAPTIDEALLESCSPSLPSAPTGLALHRVTLNGAQSRCNDGSPPVVFVRTALNTLQTDEWVIHLDGGSSCDDYESCSARWCGNGPYNASDMSSKWAPMTVSGAGILGANFENSFGGTNIAQLHYCSSDFWLGTASDALLEPEAGQGSAYALHFEGDAILDEVLDALEAGVTSDDGTQQLPSLTLGTSIVFAGSSAGGFGAALQLNQLAQRNPQARVIGVVDAAISPALETLSSADAALLQAQIEGQWASPGQDTWKAVVDVNCAASTPDEDLWRCFDIDQVIRRHIDLPLAYHHDLYDPVIGDFFEAAGLEREPFIDATIDTLRLYAESPLTSVHASACALHMSLVRDADFLDLSVNDLVVGGFPHTMHEAVRAAVDGGKIVVIDDANGQGSTCP